MDLKSHWEHVYENKTPEQVSWTQKVPQTSLDLLDKFEPSKNDPIIDIGGGDSLLVDFLLEQGFSDITVLDISGAALKRAQKRLGKELSSKVRWIESDITSFQPERNYHTWHDRAVFHFLTKVSDIEYYKNLVTTSAKNIVLGTFSENGPLKCSRLEIKQYSATQTEDCFSASHKLLETFTIDHKTPFDTIQNFRFSRLQK